MSKREAADTGQQRTSSSGSPPSPDSYLWGRKETRKIRVEKLILDGRRREGRRRRRRRIRGRRGRGRRRRRKVGRWWRSERRRAIRIGQDPSRKRQSGGIEGFFHVELEHLGADFNFSDFAIALRTGYDVTGRS